MRAEEDNDYDWDHGKYEKQAAFLNINYYGASN